MKKLWLIAAVLIELLAACTLDLGFGDEYDGYGNQGPKTAVIFENTGPCTAMVYNDTRRRDEDFVVEVPSYKNSAEIEWAPGTANFYFSYRIGLSGIGGLSIDYRPIEFGIGKDQTMVRVDKDKRVTVPVPALSATVPSPDTRLTNKTYITVYSSSVPFRLVKGGSPITPDNASVPEVNPMEQAVYTVTAGPASAYHLLVSPAQQPFPADLDLEEGFAYSFSYSGYDDVKLNRKVEITVQNAAEVRDSGGLEWWY